MDIMILDSKPVLHIVDTDKKFGTAVLLRGESAAEVWRKYMNEWVSTYVWFPDWVALDQRPQFQSHEFQRFLSGAGINVKPPGIESQNDLGNGERYKAYLRTVYEKIQSDVPIIKRPDASRLEGKAVKDTSGPSGLVTTLLVLGVLKRLTIHPRDLPDQSDRMRAMQLSTNEMSQDMARERLNDELRRNVPTAVDTEVRILDRVLVYREKPVEKWLGQFTVHYVQDKAVFVNAICKTMNFRFLTM